MTPSMLKRYRENMNASYQPEGELVEKKMTKKDIKKRDEIADAISTKDMKDRYGDKNVKYAIATKIVMDKKKKKKKKKNMNEQLGAMKQNLAQRQLAQSNMEKIGNSRVKITKTTGTGAGGLKNMEVSDSGTVGKFMQDKINQSGSGMTANSLGVLDVGKLAVDKGNQALDSNSLIPQGMKGVLKKGLQDKALKINQNIPGTDAFKMKNVAMGINQKNLKASYNMDKSVIESDLIIQDWKKDDIKYTEVESVDIIKPQPLKPSVLSLRLTFCQSSSNSSLQLEDVGFIGCGLIISTASTSVYLISSLFQS